MSRKKLAYFKFTDPIRPCEVGNKTIGQNFNPGLALIGFEQLGPGGLKFDDRLGYYEAGTIRKMELRVKSDRLRRIIKESIDTTTFSNKRNRDQQWL